MNTLDQLHERLCVLERKANRDRQSVRRYRLLCAALTLTLVGLLGAAASTMAPVSDVVQTRRLEVVDANGALVFAAHPGRNGGMIDLWNSAGRNLVRISCNDHGGDLARPGRLCDLE